MLRIHFTGEDLARIRIAAEPDPLWELLISMNRLRRRDAGVIYGSWLKETLPQVPASTRALTALAPPVGYSVDFLTAAAGAGLDHRIEALRATPLPQVHTDLREFTRRNPTRRLPLWSRELVTGEATGLGRMADAADAYFAAVLTPYWDRIRVQVNRDRSRRSTTLLNGGWDAVLSTLHPSARWDYPVLHLDYPVDQELHLRGRGLLLQPSFFCRHAPTTFADPTLSPVLVYPIEHQVDWAAPRTGSADGRALATLVGPTRAVLLHAVADGTASTGELARRASTTAPNASRHIAALREVSLVSSHRHRNTMLHTVTDLGLALLSGADPLLPVRPG
ncbi:ArsR/SmtB family transcription factor [Streptomyces olivochromogenes]|uniref:ArsR/SmtB family transcription factor n=1 Tax=Streptomyces olivochromogenes TaxID=1963 RepID=UPI001F42B5D3|nr:winged helix-turn-helix domain-containing protein [Streptomyces olivochromogenes]MCF3133670.1 winged helix-turn-helix transcriptional regulator [Streptomyces olivochromogenes]